MAFLNRRPNNPPVFTTPTLPMTGPAAPPQMPTMPVVSPPAPMPIRGPGEIGIGGTAPIMPPSNPGPNPMPVPPEGAMPMPVRGGTLKKLMFERDRLQARLDQINARIQELMQGQGSGKPQEGIGNLLEQLLRNQSERGGFGD